MDKYATSIITEIIKDLNKNLYFFSGGTIAPLLVEAKNSKVNIIRARHEQGAGFMAIGDSILENKPSFCAVTSGPGLTNVITCIADAYYDNFPVVFFAGQVDTKTLGRSRFLRQRGFQEVKTEELVKSITKKVYLPKDVDELVLSLADAIFESSFGRYGPVLIELPMDIQLKKVSKNYIEDSKLFIKKYVEEKKFLVKLKKDIYLKNIEKPKIKEVIDILRNSNKPIVLVGGGCAQEADKIRELLGKLNIPIVSSIKGIGVAPRELSYGWIGHVGCPWSNEILYESDTIIALGSRLDLRQTGTETDIFKNKNLILVNDDTSEIIYSRIPYKISFKVSVVNFLELLVEEYKFSYEIRKEWNDKIKELINKKTFLDKGKSKGISPNEFFEVLKEYIKNIKSFAVVSGVGQHQMWTARYLYDIVSIPKNIIVSSYGHGTMGNALPTGLGISISSKYEKVIIIDGDGSFQLNIQELQTAIEQNVKNVIVFILNNASHGIVAQFEELTFGNYTDTRNILNPDFSKIAGAYGLKSFKFNKLNKEFEKVLEEFINSEEFPFTIVEIMIDDSANAFPILLGGDKLNQMTEGFNKNES